MLGVETLIALLALVLATVALVQIRVKAKPAPAPVPGAAPQGRSLAVVEQHLEQLASRVSSLEATAREQEALLCALVTEDEARHLWNLSKADPAIYELHPGVETELRSLVRRGLVNKIGTFKIHELPSTFELRERFELSASGKQLLRVRNHLEQSDRRKAESLPPRPPTGDTGKTAPRDVPVL